MSTRKKTLAGLTGKVALTTATAPGAIKGTIGIGGLGGPVQLARIQATLQSVLGELKGPDNEKLLTVVQIEQLEAITMTSGDKYFSLETDARHILYQIIGQIYTWGYDVVYTALTTADIHSRIGFYFHDSTGMEYSRHKLRVDSEIYRNKIEVAKGAFKCRKCGSEETISVESQKRGADEPTTVNVTCIHCGNKW